MFLIHNAFYSSPIDQLNQHIIGSITQLRKGLTIGSWIDGIINPTKPFDGGQLLDINVGLSFFTVVINGRRDAGLGEHGDRGDRLSDGLGV